MRKLIFKFLDNFKENVRKITIELKFVNYFIFYFKLILFINFSINNKIK